MRRSSPVAIRKDQMCGDMEGESGCMYDDHLRLQVSKTSMWKPMLPPKRCANRCDTGDATSIATVMVAAKQSGLASLI